MASDSAVKVPTQQSVKAYVLSIAQVLNPIGTIRSFNVSTNPATLLGFGTWTAHGAGRVEVCLNAADTGIFDTVDGTYGEKTHTLLSGESGLVGHNHIQDAHRHVECAESNSSGGSLLMVGDATGGGNQTTSSSTSSTTATNQAIAAANAVSAHNNIQPSIVTYRWVRTA